MLPDNVVLNPVPKPATANAGSAKNTIAKNMIKNRLLDLELSLPVTTKSGLQKLRG